MPLHSKQIQAPILLAYRHIADGRICLSAPAMPTMLMLWKILGSTGSSSCKVCYSLSSSNCRFITNGCLATIAKIGFGKTFITKAVITDLAAEAENPETSDEPPATASYRFNAESLEARHADNAFRALTSQLLQTHHHDRLMLDSACLLLRRTSCRDAATPDEVLECLAFLLHRHPTFLVIDGLDDCNDLKDFLTSLARVCRKSDARVVLFGRPSMKIPLEYQKWASDAPHIISLGAEHNAAAIEQLVAHDLNQIGDQGFFGISMDRTLIPQVSRIADGGFLWTSMLMQFFRSRLLSSDERHAVLANIQSLAGLDALYCNILNILERLPGHEKRVIADVFRWLSFPVNRLCPSALRAALSTFDPDLAGGSSPNDIIDKLPELTCGLLRVHNRTLSFTHGSLRDYLRSSASHHSEFTLYNESDVHAQLAARCLSYLAHDVPKRPLGGLRPRSPPMLPTLPTSSGASQRTNGSGDSGYKSLASSDGDTHTPQPTPITHNYQFNQHIREIPFDTHLPFLRYASLCWPIHLSRALSPHTTANPATLLPYLPALSAFLTSRLSVTAWVEASFRYALPPTLTRLVGPLSDLKGEVSPATLEGKELRMVVVEMRELSERLVEVKRQGEGWLRQNPSLIWQMEDVKEGWWPVWEDVVGAGRASRATI